MKPFGIAAMLLALFVSGYVTDWRSAALGVLIAFAVSAGFVFLVLDFEVEVDG